MYDSHFGLRQRPFRPTPDSDCYYPATTHEYALARLLAGIEADEGLLLLTGDPGTGKTLLCHRLLERLPADTVSAFVTNSRLVGRAALLQAILFELSLPYEGRAEQEMRLGLTDFLLQNARQRKRAVILVDEAQHLTADLLEELRLLGNLEAGAGKAVQMVLLAQPAIQQTLMAVELTAVRQRLSVRAHLEPLDVREGVDYLVHHLRAVGGKPEALVSDEALEMIARAARGVPRLLNQAAHQAFAVAADAGAEQVDAEAALEALAALGLEAEEVVTEDDVVDELETSATESEDAAPTRRLFPPSRRPA
ncbi:MAG: AAA family ATPase [Gemmataceae bacterium]|nr:AAA family ATPase [Gemmataceae bacterium]